MSFTETLQGLTGKPLADCTNQELYLALLELVRQKSADRVQPVTGRSEENIIPGAQAAQAFGTNRNGPAALRQEAQAGDIEPAAVIPHPLAA